MEEKREKYLATYLFYKINVDKTMSSQRGLTKSLVFLETLFPHYTINYYHYDCI
jgi:hypothetical protein